MKSLTNILACLPKQRRTGLFSATMTDGLSELVRVGLRNSVRVVVKVEVKRKNGSLMEGQALERRIPAGSVIRRLLRTIVLTHLIFIRLHIFYTECPSSEKLIQLFHIINHEASCKNSSRFIVYFATCACVDYLYRVQNILKITVAY